MLKMLELCAGYGGFSLALGGVAETVCYVERDSYAAAVLVARMREGCLSAGPIWSDLTTFDAAPWRGRVDLVTAGFPCQPFSAAGQRRGLDDDRWLWPHIARIIGEVRPRFVFLENVRGLVRAGLPAVLHDLANLGFDAEWGLYSAAAVGAPHKRERIWIVAHHHHQGRSPVGWEPEHDGDARRDADGSSSTHVGHAGRAGRSEVTRRPHGDESPHGSQHGHVTDGASKDVGHAAGVGCGEGQRPDPHERESRRTYAQVAGHRFPPRPDDHDGWAEWDGAQPSIRRSPDGAPRWLADQLHLGGNGLVPQAAREAWNQLTGRLGVTP